VAHVNRKQYWKVFVGLTVLTVLEVAVATIPGIGKIAIGTALCLLALVKAAMVGWYYMHLSHETAPLKLSVAIPMAVPVFYAFVLIAEAAWRLI
jgi:caa(3)-type oxidase subunit IV